MVIYMSELVSKQPEVTYVTPTPEQRAAALNLRGFELIKDVSHNLDALLASGIMRETTNDYTRAQNQAKYELAPTGIPGGWREVAHLEGARVTLVQPAAEAPAGTGGYLEVEMTGLINGGRQPGTGAARPDTVQVAIDGNFAAHVDGRHGQWRYSVDRPNPNTFGQDYQTAGTMLGRAETVVQTLFTEADQQPPAPQQ